MGERKRIRDILLPVIFALVAALPGQSAFAQAFGVELHNTLMPASGAMGGASLARPQDVQSAIYGNPATLTRFRGTQFGFSGAWVEPTYKVAHTGGVLPNLGAFSAKSNAQGAALGNIGVTQDFSALGLPATMGMGLFSSSGAGVSFRNVPQSNGTSALIQAIAIVSGVGIDLTDRLSAGATIHLGSATLDGPFLGITAAAYDYALRGSVGLNYEVGPETTFGFYYQTKQEFNFDNAIQLSLPGGGNAPAQDIDVGLPDNIGFGIANERLLDGRLLLALDVLYKQWENADLFAALFQNQWVFQVGAQYRWSPRLLLRLGYAYAENAIDPITAGSAGGVTPPPPVGAGLQYVQAQFAAINQHRLSGGFGIHNVLPGVDFDLIAGGMFESFEQFGPFTSASMESYWVGAGMTWRFGRGACENGESCH